MPTAWPNVVVGTPLTRRRLLVAAAIVAGTIASCGSTGAPSLALTADEPSWHSRPP